jgi:MYXO-CTERM domain-containing protein
MAKGRWCAAPFLAAALFGCGIPDEPVERSDRPEAIAITTDPALAPSWAVAYGTEFWRRPAADGSTTIAINLGDVIERVSHAIARASDDELPRVRASRYTAAFDGVGLRFAAGSSPDQLRVRTSRVSINGSTAYSGGAKPWSVVGNTAQALLAPDIVEHYETRDDGVELSWIIRDRILELDVEAAIEGDVKFRIGAAELVDARGERWPVATQTSAAGLRWHVGHDLLARATFPIALDPIISPELTVEDEVLTNSLQHQYSPQVAWNPAGYFVAWSDGRAESGLYATRVSPAGVVLDPAGIRIADASDVVIASNANEYLVVWPGSTPSPTDGYADIVARRVSHAGVVLDSADIVIAKAPSWQFFPAVASNGTDFFVAWEDQRNQATQWSDIYGTRVTAAGVVTAPNGIPISTTATSEWEPAVGSNGTDFIVVWAEDHQGTGQDLYASRVSASGSVIDPDRFLVSNAASNQFRPAIAFNGDAFLLAWQDSRAGNTDIYAMRLDAAGATLDGGDFAVASTPNDEIQPAVASNASDFLVSWCDNSSFGVYDVYASRVSAAGVVADPAGIALTVGPTHALLPSIASFGDDYLVAWHQYRNVSWDVLAAIVTAAGTVAVNQITLARTAQEYEPAIASNGTTFLVTWTDGRTHDSSAYDIMGARLSASGTMLDPAGIAISRAQGDQKLSAVTSNGTDYLVAWQDQRNGTGVDVFASRVTAAGVVADAAGLAVTVAAEDQTSIALASDGNDYLVAWQELHGALDIYASRVTATGIVADPGGFVVSNAYDHQRSVSVASTGSQYLVTWETNFGIYASRVSTAGAVLDPTGLPIAPYDSAHRNPSVASNGTDYLVAWQRGYNNSHDIYATRVATDGTLLDPNPFEVAFATGEQTDAVVASDGADYLVMWQDARANPYSFDVYACRVSAAGSMWDPSGLAIATSSDSETMPTLTYNAASASYGVTYGARNRAFARLVRFCGDGLVEATETCDDGSLAAGDGCSATCKIETGYQCTGTPSQCSDINECATNNGGCSVNAICTNAAPGFACACASGFSGDGITCVDADECATNHGGCAADATCTNTSGSRTCACNAGFTGDGVTCTDVDECATDNGGCAADAKCTNTSGGRSCACSAGYSGDGVTCMDIDECASGNGGCAQVCVNAAGSFTCACNSGYALASDGSACMLVDECLADPTACEPSEPDDNGGCGCRSTHSSSPALWLFAIVLLLRRRRR